MDIDRKDIVEFEGLKEHYEMLLQYHRPPEKKFEKQFFSSSFSNYGFQDSRRIKIDRVSDTVPTYQLKSIALKANDAQKREEINADKMQYDDMDLEMHVQDLKPLRVQLRTKNTKKCDCNKILAKPDTKAQSLAFLARSMLSGIVPKATVLEFKPYASNQFQLTLKYVNTSQMNVQVEVAQFEDPNITVISFLFKLELNSSFNLQKYPKEWPKFNNGHVANVVINASAELTVDVITIRNRVTFVIPDEYNEENTLDYQFEISLDQVKKHFKQ
ncbi:hypothetical protein HDV01_007691 [Terramyces sp. JEL0728]|nr:hypothetical protein HDV01_007691 [Terramyces sp. JEL0728]